jgi:DNA invertase Pin-like site-specific DNA recombinase
MSTRVFSNQSEFPKNGKKPKEIKSTGLSQVPKLKNKTKVTPPNVYIYLRCSTGTQSVDTHEEEIKGYCQQNSLKYTDQNVFRDQGISGNKHWKKRHIFTIIDKCKKGDHIVVSELSRLSRRARDIHEIIGLMDDRGINLHCIKEKIRNDGTMASNMMLGMLSIMSQMERDMTIARTKSAMETMKQRGVKVGRKLSSPLDEHRLSIEKDYKDGILTNTEIAEKYGVSRQLMYEYAINRNIIQKKSYQDIVLKVPDKSPSGRKIKGSMYDKYIDHINKDLQIPNIKLTDIADKYDFKYESFKLWFKSRCQ